MIKTKNKKRRKKFGSKFLSSLLACLIAFTCLIAGTVSASAIDPDYLDDVDWYGNNICEYMEDFLTDWCFHYFYSRVQVSPQRSTIVLVDDQLVDYGFLDHICQAFSNRFGGEFSLDNFYEHTGIRFYVQYSGYTFYDLELRENGNLYAFFDLSDEDTFAQLRNYVGAVNMCAIGVWDPGNAFFDVAKTLQDLWDGNLPCYFIYRDPIVIGEDGLNFLSYDSIDDFFYDCSEAPGVTYQ